MMWKSISSASRNAIHLEIVVSVGCKMKCVWLRGRKQKSRYPIHVVGGGTVTPNGQFSLATRIIFLPLVTTNHRPCFFHPSQWKPACFQKSFNHYSSQYFMENGLFFKYNMYWDFFYFFHDKCHTSKIIVLKIRSSN